jgi:hypothetical protein
MRQVELPQIELPQIKLPQGSVQQSDEGGARKGVEPSPTQVDISRSCRLRRRAAQATGGSLAL